MSASRDDQRRRMIDDGTVGLARFQIGSLRCSVSSDLHGYVDTLAELYRVDVQTGISESAAADLILEFVESPVSPARETNQLIVEPIPGGHRLTTDAASIEMTHQTGQHHMIVTVTDPGVGRAELSFHFWILLNRALLLLDRLLLHAAAFVVDGRVIVVCGDNGAGKSTLTVAFGLLGASLLSDDSLLVTRRTDRFVVSGLTSQMRVPRETEDRLLAGRVLHRQITEDGRNKRMVDAEQLFTTRLGLDLSPDRLVFLRNGGQTRVSALSGGETLLGLINNTRFTYRFGDTADISDHLDLVADLAMSVPGFEAIRTESLDDLDALVELIAAP